MAGVAGAKRPIQRATWPYRSPAADRFNGIERTIEEDAWCGPRIGREGNHMTSKRNVAAILGGVAAVALFLIVNPWFAVDPKSTADQVVTVTFWVSFIALLVVLFEMRKEPGGETIEVEGPAFTRFLFGNTRAGLFWLPIRLFVGFTWLEAGYHKFSGTGWMDGGAALQGYWQHAVAIPAQGAGSPAITPTRKQISAWSICFPNRDQ